MQFRQYQQDAIDAWWEYFARRDGNPLIAMPTGTGKSVVIAGLVRSIYKAYPHTRCMMLTHVKELIQQNMEKLLTLWPTAPAGVYSAGLKRKEHRHRITFAGIGSVFRKPELFEHIDILFIDEAHLVSPSDATMYQKFIDGLRQRNPKLKVCGLSATCYRMGIGSLTEGGMFTDICYDLTTPAAFSMLIAAGYLAPLDAKRTDNEFDITGVGTVAGEYNLGELERAVDVDEKTYKVIGELVRKARAEDRKRWLIFAVSVHHVESIVKALEMYGVDAVPIHSDLKRLPAEQRETNYKAFKAGRVTCAVSMNAMTTGVDVPEIDLIGMLRHTKSTPLWVQMLGRGTRPAPGKKDCLVLDFTSNTRRLGPIDDPVIPQKPGKKKKKGGVCPVKLCGVCGSYVHHTWTQCKKCGNEMLQSLKVEEHSSGLKVMALESPIVEELPVTTITYHHKKPRQEGKPPNMLVTYFCGLRSFHEYVCLEHPDGSFAQRKAHQWWAERCTYKNPDGTVPLPSTVAEAVQAAIGGWVRKPSKIKVWSNKPKYPEITGYVYE